MLNWRCNAPKPWEVGDAAAYRSHRDGRIHLDPRPAQARSVRVRPVRKATSGRGRAGNVLRCAGGFRCCARPVSCHRQRQRGSRALARTQRADFARGRGRFHRRHRDLARHINPGGNRLFPQPHSQGCHANRTGRSTASTQWPGVGRRHQSCQRPARCGCPGGSRPGRAGRNE